MRCSAFAIRRFPLSTGFLLSTLALALVAGCDTKTKAPAKSSAAKSSTAAKASVAKTDDATADADADNAAKSSAKELALGEYSPKLDRGRLEVAQPAGWYVPPRDPKYLIRFQLDAGTVYPSIIVRAEDEPSVPDVTAENVEKFAEQVREETSGKKLQAPVKATKLGPHAGITYIGPSVNTTVKGAKIPIDQLFFITATGGRRYIVELRARQGEVEQHRKHTALVASSLKFHSLDPGSEQPAATTGEVATKATPAENRTHTLGEKIPIPGLPADNEKGLDAGGISPPMPEMPKAAAGDMPKTADGKEMPAEPKPAGDAKPTEPKPLGEKIPIPGLPPG